MGFVDVVFGVVVFGGECGVVWYFVVVGGGYDCYWVGCKGLVVVYLCV